MIWSALFAVGNFLYGRVGFGLALAGIFAVSGLILLSVIRRLWAAQPQREIEAAPEPDRVAS
jgi:hypothetical protein